MIMSALLDRKPAHRVASKGAPSEPLNPLKIFGNAKKRIRELYVDIGGYVKDSVEFSRGVNDESILSTDQTVRLQSHTDKVSNIKEILSRDRMKVVFFGRTSNGKSTVINSMLRSKILPSGIGHTTHCFVQVEGCDSPEGYLLMEGSNEKRNINSLKDLANALSTAKVVPNTLIRICWPRDKCHLLRDDILLVDSPGIDVSPDLDTWIDKFCLDADVFVLVANAESTLMQTEKNFFLRVSDRLSSPTVFVLNNRWDASASEPEMMESVKAQHLERNIHFLSKELQVATPEEARERIFFVSAKETLHQRLTESGQAVTPVIQLDGYQTRLFDFANFETIFQECLSRSAVKTKFAQHSKRGKKVVVEIKKTMESALDSSLKHRETSMADRTAALNYQSSLERDLNTLTQEIETNIRNLTDTVERKVSQALSDEIKRLSRLVSDFSHPFHPHPSVLAVYKRTLHQYVERGLTENVEARCSEGLNSIVKRTNQHVSDKLLALLPESRRCDLERSRSAQPGDEFSLHYRLDAQNLCANFHEDIQFRFSYSPHALFARYFGRKFSLQTAFFRSADRRAPPVIPAAGEPSVTPGAPRPAPQDDDLTAILLRAAPALASTSTISLALGAGAICKMVGWKVFAVVGGIYGGLYILERVMWSNKAKERAFKSQYVCYATKQLKQIIDLTSSNASHQVKQELTSNFNRLIAEVNLARTDLKGEISALDSEITRYEAVAAQAKILRNKAGWLDNELSDFMTRFIENA